MFEKLHEIQATCNRLLSVCSLENCFLMNGVFQDQLKKIT